MFETLYINNRMFTIYQLVIRISLAHPPYDHNMELDGVKLSIYSYELCIYIYILMLVITIGLHLY